MMPPETPLPTNDGIPAPDPALWTQMIDWWDAHPDGNLIRAEEYEKHVQRDWFAVQEWQLGSVTFYGVVPCDD